MNIRRIDVAGELDQYRGFIVVHFWSGWAQQFWGKEARDILATVRKQFPGVKIVTEETIL